MKNDFEIEGFWQAYLSTQPANIPAPKTYHVFSLFIPEHLPL